MAHEVWWNCSEKCLVNAKVQTWFLKSFTFNSTKVNRVEHNQIRQYDERIYFEDKKDEIDSWSKWKGNKGKESQIGDWADKEAWFGLWNFKEIPFITDGHQG